MIELKYIREHKYLTKTISEYNLYDLIIYEVGSKVSPKLNWIEPDLLFNKIFKN